MNVEMILSGNEKEQFCYAIDNYPVINPIGKIFKIADWYIEDNNGFWCMEWGCVNNILFEILGRDEKFNKDFVCRLISIL